MRSVIFAASVIGLGRITSITRRPVNNFDATVNVKVPADMLQKARQGKNIYQKPVPLRPGRYRLNIAARDLADNNATNYEVALDVPRLDEDHLIASSLILAYEITRMAQAISFSTLAKKLANPREALRKS